MSIYQRIKDVASEKNITVKDIEKALNFSNGSLRKWVNNANSERLIQVANYLDVSTDYLLGRTEKKHYYDLTKKMKRMSAFKLKEY